MYHTTFPLAIINKHVQYRKIASGSNNHSENVLTNITVRLNITLKVPTGLSSDEFLKAQSRFDKSASTLELGRGMLLTNSFMKHTIATS